MTKCNSCSQLKKLPSTEEMIEVSTCVQYAIINDHSYCLQQKSEFSIKALSTRRNLKMLIKSTALEILLKGNSDSLIHSEKKVNYKSSNSDTNLKEKNRLTDEDMELLIGLYYDFNPVPDAEFSKKSIRHIFDDTDDEEEVGLDSF